ncbi:hypothetical protein MAJ_11095, partial [Metarhizium majus ARSEF 297]
MDENRQIDFSPLCARDPRVDRMLIRLFDDAVNAVYHHLPTAPSFYEKKGITEQIDFSPLCARDPRVDRMLIRLFDDAVNAVYHHLPTAPSFYEKKGITDVRELIDVHARQIKLASTWIIAEERKKEFKDRAELGYWTPEDNRTLSITLLRLASYVPDTHPGQEFLKEVLVDFFLQNRLSEHGRGPEIFREALLELWRNYRPARQTEASDRIKALFRPDEWVNFNAFVAIIYGDLDIGYDEFAVQGLGLVLLDSPGSLNQALTADHRALTASAWIHYGDGRLLHLVNNFDCLVFNDIHGREWRLDKDTWELMKDNFATILLHVENEFIYDHSRSIWYNMVLTGQNIN